MATRSRCYFVFEDPTTYASRGSAKIEVDDSVDETAGDFNFTEVLLERASSA
jgi:hypothetical protein